MARAPISAESQTALPTVAPGPTTVSRSTQPGPTRAPAAITVRPSRWVDGPTSASGSRVTPTSNQVVAVFTIVTPARIQYSSSRSLYSRRATASCTRSFTP